VATERISRPCNSSRWPVVGEPARGYSWPAFKPGNRAADKHGAYSPRLVKPIAERLRAELIAAAPCCGHLARVEAQIRLTWDALDRGADVSADRLDRLEARAHKLRSALGMNLTAWARALSRLSSAPDADSRTLDEPPRGWSANP
jgi:hypothetical protein